MVGILAYFMDGVAYFIHMLTSSHIMEDYFMDRGDILHYIVDMEDYFMDIWNYYIICDIFSHYLL